jgi:hypothetical protein
MMYWRPCDGQGFIHMEKASPRVEPEMPKRPVSEGSEDTMMMLSSHVNVHFYRQGRKLMNKKIVLG